MSTLDNSKLKFILLGLQYDNIEYINYNSYKWYFILLNDDD